jgi:hypothetical protein
MLRFHAEKFVALSNSLGKMAVFISSTRPHAHSFNDDSQKFLSELFAPLEELGLEMCKMKAQQVLKAIKSPSPDMDLVLADFEELHNRIFDELKLQMFFSIPAAKSAYFENAAPFGDEVFDSFPDAIRDIEEASKCFAVGRHTACVMHLQRALEVVVRSFGVMLGAKLSDNTNWGVLLNSTRDAIQKRNSSNSWGSKEEKEFCEHVQPMLYSIKQSWRNTSMHVDRSYDEAEAEDIFNSVKGFMRHMAKHLNQDGVFTT